MKTFYHVLANTLVASVTNFFVWFALTYWVYLETLSVLTTSVMAGVFLTATALSGFWFGAIVDHNKKKYAMLLSSFLTISIYIAGLLLFVATPREVMTDVTQVPLWAFIVLILFGSVAGNIRGIALPTLVTILVPEGARDKANGLAGTIMGISFLIASIASGFAIAFFGMLAVLVIAIVCILATIVHLILLPVHEPGIVHLEGAPKRVDIKGTLVVVSAIPGLLGLIFFTTFNNFLGGVFMSLMDPYGLTLVSVQVWGVLWGVLSLGFIIGGLYIAKNGLGKNPVRTLFLINVFLWSVTIIFPLQHSIILLAIGMLIYMCLMPFIEASEHTIIQKVVPLERQGRVFGFAQSVEQSASPITAFLIGPIAQFIFIPFMTTGAGVELIGEWFGVGLGRGIALVFIIAGVVGLATTLIAMRTKAYKLLSSQYIS